MHAGLVARTAALLVLLVSAFMLFPVVFAVYYGELSMLPHFLVPIMSAAVSCGIVLLLTRRSSKSLSPRDAFLLVSLSWLLSALLGALPFRLSGAVPRYVDAFFETMSGFTTTGASILTNIEALPKSLLFWRSLTHWLGGMGIIVLTIAVLPLLGVGAYQMMKAEAPGPALDKIAPRVTQMAKILWFIYLSFTLAEVALLMGAGMSLFDALTHTFGTLATGGFSPKNASVGHYDSAAVDAIITVFMLLAGLNFGLYYGLVTGNARRVVANLEMKVYLAIFASCTVAVAVVLLGRQFDSLWTSLRFAGFQTASILTTTGYTTADYASWPPLSRAVLFALMFVGGCSGSTGGGIKVIRVVSLFKLGLNEMKVLGRPQGVFSLRVGRQTVKKDMMYSIAGFFFLYLLVLLVTTLVIGAGGNDLLTSFSGALVTVGNIGPGFGRLGPTHNYAFLPPYVKWYLGFAMMAGRLEIYTVLMLLTPGFWRS
jgi:trk system potassium uptake protein TrkH